MSKSHADVGHDFANLRVGKGSRMATYPEINTTVPNARLFFDLAHGYSYQTEVARLVLNTHTNLRELWLTPTRHSSSTQRHMGYYRAGFRSWCAKHQPTVDTNEQIFVTPALIYQSTRTAAISNGLCRHVSDDLLKVDAPRTREATRRGVLASCSYRLAHEMRLMTQGVPMDNVDINGLYALQELDAFISSLQGIADIDEVRITLRAHIALNKY